MKQKSLLQGRDLHCSSSVLSSFSALPSGGRSCRPWVPSVAGGTWLESAGRSGWRSAFRYCHSLLCAAFPAVVPAGGSLLTHRTWVTIPSPRASSSKGGYGCLLLFLPGEFPQHHRPPEELSMKPQGHRLGCCFLPSALPTAASLPPAMSASRPAGCPAAPDSLILTKQSISNISEIF